MSGVVLSMLRASTAVPSLESEVDGCADKVVAGTDDERRVAGGGDGGGGGMPAVAGTAAIVDTGTADKELNEQRVAAGSGVDDSCQRICLAWAAPWIARITFGWLTVDTGCQLTANQDTHKNHGWRVMLFVRSRWRPLMANKLLQPTPRI